MINLGDKAKDMVTGFEGICVARTEWLNGCTRITLQSDKLKEGVPGDNYTFDEPQLRLVKAGAVKPGPKDTGGPIPTPKRNPNPVR